MIVEWNDGTMLDLKRFDAYDEYQEWLEKNCRSRDGISYPKRAYVTDESLRWAYGNLFAILMQDEKDYFYLRDSIKSEDDLKMLSDYVDVHGLIDARYWKASKAVGSYDSWDDFVEKEAEGIKGCCDCEYCDFNYGKFEKNLDLEYGIGEYGTVYRR